MIANQFPAEFVLGRRFVFMQAQQIWEARPRSGTLNFNRSL